MRDSNNNSEAMDWIEGCKQWLEEHCTNGWWRPYYVNFMFEPLPGSTSAVVAQMRRAITSFYGCFCTRFTRNPRAESEHLFLPLFWLFPDKHTWKRDSTLNVHDATFNDGGLHFNGPMLIPRISRLRSECPIQHLETNQAKYARWGISRIHAKPMHRMADLPDYAAKTMKWGRADPADILVLPRAAKELQSRALLPQDPRERAIKAVEAAFNVSREVATRLAKQ